MNLYQNNVVRRNFARRDNANRVTPLKLKRIFRLDDRLARRQTNPGGQVDLVQSRSAELLYAYVHGSKFALWNWPGFGPQILLIHAAGFHSRCWNQVVANLPADFDCWAIDMRGHGLSNKPSPPYFWRQFGEDIKAVTDLLTLDFDVAVGHSMGGHSVAYAAALNPSLAKSLVLIDPMIARRDLYTKVEENTEYHPAERRKNHWQSLKEMFEEYRGKAPFDTWDERVLRDYCQHGLLPTLSGEGYDLACPPNIEGSIHKNSLDLTADIYEELPKIRVPVKVLHAPVAAHENTEHVIPIDLGKYFQKGEDEQLQGFSHFVPMQAPVLVAEEIRQMLQ
jgi:pimeloyl-ACP methyl ester carboxylesterase